jgi:hypothetical protein
MQEIKFELFFYFTTTEGKELSMWLIASLIRTTEGAGCAPLPSLTITNHSVMLLGMCYVTMGQATFKDRYRYNVDIKAQDEILQSVRDRSTTWRHLNSMPSNITRSFWSIMQPLRYSLFYCKQAVSDLDHVWGQLLPWVAQQGLSVPIPLSYLKTEAASSSETLYIYNFIIQTIDEVQKNIFMYYKNTIIRNLQTMTIHCGLKYERVFLKRALHQKPKFSGSKEVS